MAGEKSAGNNPANPGSGPSGGNANKGPSKNNRRRSLRSKRRGRKPEEGSEAREPRTQPSAPKPVEKSVRDNRDRRRRRRMRAKQRGPETQPSMVEDVLKDLPPLVPAFVYTHVLRPAMRDSFEFRTEHFSKVTRKLEDFHIDLSPLYPDGGDEIKGVAYMPPNTDRTVFEDDADDDIGDDGADDEGYDDPDWDSEQSEDAARIDGATTGVIADEFYADMDDSVIDETPEEDIDA